MTTQKTEVRNLAALIRALGDLSERAQSGYHTALVQPAKDALEIAVASYRVHSGTHDQLERAIASISVGNLDEAVAYIGIAQKIQAAWVGSDLNGASERQP